MASRFGSTTEDEILAAVPKNNKKVYAKAIIHLSVGDGLYIRGFTLLVFAI